jgi:hypothetical protein
MRLVVQPEARDHIDSHGGTIYLWARATGCCRGRTLLLESATEPPDRTVELVHAADGFQIFATPGLAQPEELHLEVTRRGKLQAFWNGQGWIG